MPIRGRGSLNLPFIRLNWTRHGLLGLPRLNSWTVHVGPWSRNSRSGRHRVDLPGPHHWWQSKIEGKRIVITRKIPRNDWVNHLPFYVELIQLKDNNRSCGIYIRLGTRGVIFTWGLTPS